MNSFTRTRWQRDSIIRAKNEAIRILYEACHDVDLTATDLNRSTDNARRAIESWSDSLINKVIEAGRKAG